MCGGQPEICEDERLPKCAMTHWRHREPRCRPAAPRPEANGSLCCRRGLCVCVVSERVQEIRLEGAETQRGNVSLLSFLPFPPIKCVLFSSRIGGRSMFCV